MRILLGHTGCTLSGQHLTKHSAGVVLNSLLQPVPYRLQNRLLCIQLATVLLWAVDSH